jgi:hypothetical protein
VHHYAQKSQDKKFVIDLVEFITAELDDLESKDIESLQGEDREASVKLMTKYVHFLHSLSKSNYRPLGKVLEKNVFKEPIRNWQLETMADNASVYGQNLWYFGGLGEGIEMMLKCFKQQTDAEGRQLVKYALHQLVINIRADKIPMFINHCQLFLRDFNFGDHETRNGDMLMVYLDCMIYFFDNSDLDLAKYVNWILENCSPLLIYKDEKNPELVEKVFSGVGDLFRIILTKANRNLARDTMEFLMYEQTKNNERIAIELGKVNFLVSEKNSRKRKILKSQGSPIETCLRIF